MRWWLLPVLTLPPLGSAACGDVGSGDTDITTDWDAETDGDADTDTDHHGPGRDAEVASFWYEATFQTAEGAFVGGTWGTVIVAGATNPSWADLLCDNTGTWSYLGPAPEGCPDCAWAFELAVTATVADGEYCPDFQRVGGEWDGFDRSWGYATFYDYLYGDAVYRLQRVIWYYDVHGADWVPLFYNYDGSNYNYGDAADLTARRNYGLYSYYPH